MADPKGWQQNFMISLFKKGAIDAALPVNATNFCSLKGHDDWKPEYADALLTDYDEVTGSEHATDQELNTQGLKFTITMKHARPNFIFGCMLMAMGSHSSAQDGAVDAWKHTGSIIAPGTALPYVNVIGKKGGIQRLDKGVVCNSVGIWSEEGGPISCTAEFLGSGHRATNADAFVAAISEARMLARHALLWTESGASISVDGTLTQGLENISTGAAVSVGARCKSWKFKYNNNCAGEFGHGGDGTFQNIDFGRRTLELSMVMRWNDATELGYYENQTNLAFEADVKGGTLIAVGGTFYPGFNLVVPRFRLNKAPLPDGGVGDKLTVPYNTIFLDDSTNPIFKFAGYNAVDVYLAA